MTNEGSSQSEQPQTKPVVKRHSYSVPNILKLRKKLLASADLVSFIGGPLNADEFPSFAQVIQGLLPAGIELGVIQDSLIHLAGQSITEKLIQKEIWRLAGNVHNLRAGKHTTPWKRQVVDEWVPVQIVDSKTMRTRKGHVGAEFALRVLGGSPAGELLTTFLTVKFCHWIAPDTGFTPSWGKLPFENLRQFVGLRLYGLVDAQKSLGTPYFETFSVSGAFANYNRKLLRQRARVDFKCPSNFKHACHKCWIGYDRCPVATHPITFVKTLCDECRKESWFDPRYVAGGLCIDCQTKHRMKKK